MDLLLVDDREPGWVIARLREKLEGFDIRSVRLESGDILYPQGSLAIERKSPGDFLASIASGRLADQVQGLCAAASFPVVVVEGSLFEKDGKVVAEGRETQWNWTSIACAILSVQARGALFLQVPQRLWADTVRVLCSWCRGKVEGELTVPKRRAVFDAPPELAFLTGLPGIGLKRAKELLDYAGTPAWALTSVTMDDPHSPVGRALREKIREFLGLLPGQVLSVIQGE